MTTKMPLSHGSEQAESARLGTWGAPTMSRVAEDGKDDDRDGEVEHQHAEDGGGGGGLAVVGGGAMEGRAGVSVIMAKQG